MILQPVRYSDNSTNGWNYNSQGASGDMQSSQNGASWSDGGVSTNFAAFDVLGTSSTVPEPVSLAFGAAGLAALFCLRRRRRA